MAKSADAFRTISEVAEWLETPAHVLRFWESKFSQIKPVKRAGGRRYYRPADMKLLGGVKRLLHEDGMTIKGVQKLLREQGVKHVASLSQPLDEVTAIEAHEGSIEAAPLPETSAEVVNLRGDTSASPAAPKEVPPQAEPDTAEDVAAMPGASEAPEHPTPDEAADTSQPEAGSAEEPAPQPGPSPVMPSFLKRKMDLAPPPEAAEEEEAPEPEPEPEEPTAPVSLMPEGLPDDPPDTEDAGSGVLTALSAVRAPIDPDALRLLRELGEQLASESGPPPA